MDPYPVYYLVTNWRRIIAVDAATGRWLHLGYATAPLMQGVAWTYQTTTVQYAVLHYGKICTADPLGKFLQIGHVIRLEE